MACFTAESDELRHDQYITFLFSSYKVIQFNRWSTKIIKNLKYHQKINIFLKISMKLPF